MKAWRDAFVKHHLVGNQEHDDSYWIIRRVVCLGLGLLYLNIFLIYYFQAPALFGKTGLLPISDFITSFQKNYDSTWNAFVSLPMLFYFFDSEFLIKAIPLVGIALSTLLVFGRANFIILFVLWTLQMSIVHSGQIFYGYGWETQILEFTFISFFFFPFFSTNLKTSAPNKLAVYFYRWMLFRLMLGAGLIKLRGDSCWWDLTCTYFHYETQPNPHPLSWYFHQLPNWFHQVEVLFNHFVEVVLPFGVFGPKRVRRWTGIIMILFQVTLIMSGNLSWLNWLTILMCVPCLDDAFVSRLLRHFKRLKFQAHSTSIEFSRARVFILITFLCVGSYLSWEPLLNLVSSEQRMNSSFNRLHLINSYGAFGSIGKKRFEVIISGTQEDSVSSVTYWQEYEFKCKPGYPERRPCLITPYHLRLDWQIWFSAMRPELQEVWLLRLGIRLLEGNKVIEGLLQGTPFKDAPPKYLKMDLYEYEFTDSGEKGWWKRKFVKPYLQPISLQDQWVQQYR